MTRRHTPTHRDAVNDGSNAPPLLERSDAIIDRRGTPSAIAGGAPC